MWKSGEVVAWRGIFRERIWHVQPTIVVKDSPSELLLTLLPGTECITEEHYPQGKKSESRRWFFVDREWNLATYTWRTNRLLLRLEPQKFYSTIFFWDDASGEFRCYYINFQTPFQRKHLSVDTLDLDLDLIIQPDFRFEWKDVDDYKKVIEYHVISPEWIQGIERDTAEVFERVNNRRYPFDGSWLDWTPEPAWVPPSLPEGWDRI
jgi:protein associated with RNAse G/E